MLANDVRSQVADVNTLLQINIVSLNYTNYKRFSLKRHPPKYDMHMYVVK